MKQNFFWTSGFIILLALMVAAIFGGGSRLTSLLGSTSSTGWSTEVEPVSITLWSDKAELFLEYPPLVVGQASTFAAHLTDLGTFHPVIQGPIEVRMTTSGKSPITFVAATPLRPGIFTPSVTMPEAGIYDMELALMNDSLTDTFRIPKVQVFTSPDEIPIQEEALEPLGLHEEVTFLKEQQWKVAFATKKAQSQVLASTITARGKIKPKTGQKVVVTAPATGLVVLPPSGLFPIMGQNVEKGELLVAIVPGFSSASRAELESAVSQAALHQDQAQRELRRARRLYEEKVVAKKRVEEAETTFLLAKNKHAEAQKRLAAFALAQQVGSAETRDTSQDFLLRAPLQGIIVQADLTLGARVEAGEALFTLINLDSVWLEARVYASDVPKISSTARASFQPHGMTGLILPEQANTHLVAIGNVIDPATKTLPVIFEVANPNHNLKVGMHADVFIETDDKGERVVIPSTAVLHETGKNVAFVQTGGETFEKRFITTGITTRREGEEVIQISEGIRVGDRVVTTGAYAIKLAAASGEIPTHSH